MDTTTTTQPGPDRQTSRLTPADRRTVYLLAEALHTPNARDHYRAVVQSFIGSEASLRPVERDEVFAAVNAARRTTA